MIEKSQVLSTIQQIKLRKLELEIEALREQVQSQSDAKEMSRSEINEDRSNNITSAGITYKTTSETIINC